MAILFGRHLQSLYGVYRCYIELVALFLLTKLFEFTTKDVSKGINFETAY